MASHAFCCDNVRPRDFEDGDYRLGIFIYWAKSGKRPQTKDDNLGLNVPFCVQVTQRYPRLTRLFVPTSWGEFAENDREFLGAPWVLHRHITNVGLIARTFGLNYLEEVSNRQPNLHKHA
ncbi:hypothetical protein DTO013E5_9753 [Penicillium roqueforti]|nr:hypothetical protein DTO012A1_4226 [Penicillium roqueforti]KAI2750208.1 hypothetical protein DTO013F2_4671 [Penicillium roqueforti]KAI3128253.1 hypothetical protein CBS147326_6755 [Penicillium roqueforti]KAI3197920.1 hypothetical protein DTO013E5_9753 [Penicillium roqueforti]